MVQRQEGHGPLVQTERGSVCPKFRVAARNKIGEISQGQDIEGIQAMIRNLDFILGLRRSH